jgi:transketolase
MKKFMQNLTKVLSSCSDRLRIQILKMITQAESGHPGGSLSAIDLMTVLFFDVMKGWEAPSWEHLSEDRDRFVLSKGHAVPALYAIFLEKGWITQEEALQLRQLGSRLQGHPDRVRLPWVEASTGSLGQGLSVALGLALGFAEKTPPPQVYCLVGDGEIQEGQIWEAALAAPKFALSHLCVILDANGGQIDGPVEQVMPLEPLVKKWESFRWNVLEVDGHCITSIRETFSQVKRLREKGSGPTLVLARTVKGKGVSFMEDQLKWHGMAPSQAQCLQAIEEIKRREEERR